MPKIKLFANIRQIAGIKEAILPGFSIREAISTLILQQPRPAAHLLENGQVRQEWIITIDGESARDVNTSFMGTDIISIFPLISGGGIALYKEKL